MFPPDKALIPKIISTFLAVASLASCAANYYNNFLAVSTVQHTAKLELAESFANISKIFIACKVSASLEFAVVASVGQALAPHMI